MAETSLTSVFENRKKERMQSMEGDLLSDRSYNLALTGLLTYGFVVNAIMVYYMAYPIQRLMAGMGGWSMLLLYLLPVIVGTFIAFGSKNPLVSFIGYNLVVVPMGLMLATFVPNLPVEIVTKAMILTAMVTVTMVLLALIRPAFFLGLGRTLFVALLVGILVEVVAMLMGYRGTLFDWFFVLLFSGYIGFDVAKSQAYPKTLDNAVDSALDIYIDVIYLFIRLLSILSKRN
jgi:hypothetical protein